MSLRGKIFIKLGIVLVLCGCGEPTEREAKVLSLRNLEGSYSLREAWCSGGQEGNEISENLSIESDFIVNADGASWTERKSDGCEISFDGSFTKEGANKLSFESSGIKCSESCSEEACAVAAEQLDRSFIVSSLTESTLVVRQANQARCSDRGGYLVSSFSRGDTVAQP